MIKCYGEGEHGVKKKGIIPLTPRSYSQYCRSEIELPTKLFVTAFEWFPSTTETARWNLIKGDRDRFIEVTLQ